MNPSGLWRGITESDGRVGHFKFINVELIPKRRSTERKRRKRANASSKGDTGLAHNKQRTEESVVYQAPNEDSLDPKGKRQFDAESSDRKYSFINTNVRENDGSLEDLRRYSHVHPSSSPDRSNSESQHKSVEDLLRRIGLEVSYFKIIIRNNLERNILYKIP